MTFLKNLSANMRIAVLVILAVVVWMFTGIFTSSDSEDMLEEQAAKAEEIRYTTVQAKRIEPQTYTRSVRLTGRTEPDVRVKLAAQTAGRITKVNVARGDMVKKGDVLLTIDLGTRQSDLTAAKATLKSAQTLANSARKLKKDGFVSDATLAQREADLATAKQRLETIQKDISYTKITAPMSGVVEEKLVNAGDYISVGTQAFELIGQDEFLIVANVAQQDRDRVVIGSVVTSKLANGQDVEGKIRHIATDADENSRTYRVDIVVDGKKHKIPTGMTADVSLPIEEIKAYKIPHAIVVLADDGTVGVMGFESDNDVPRAKFIEVDMLEDTTDGLWVSGLPQHGVELIVLGQGGLKAGNPVQVELISDANN